MDLHLITHTSHRHPIPGEIRIGNTQSIDRQLACDTNHFQVCDDHWQRLQKSIVRDPMLFSSVVRASARTTILHKGNDRSCAEKAGCNLPIQEVETICNGRGQWKANAFDLGKDIPSSALVENEMRLANSAAMQFTKKIGNSLPIGRHLASDLDENQQLFGLGTKVLPLNLMQRNFRCQRRSTVRCFSKPIGDYAENHSCYNCCETSAGGPSVPLWNAFFSKPPTAAQRVEKLHCLTLPCTGRHFATPTRQTELRHG